MIKVSKNYLAEENKAELIKLYEILYSNLKDFSSACGLNEEELEEYFIPERHTRFIKKDFTEIILLCLCSSLQNSGMMHNSIRFNEKTRSNREIIIKALYNLNLKKCASNFHKYDDIYERFKELGIKDNGSRKNKETNWEKYCKGLYDGITFLYKENGIQIIKNLTKSKELTNDNLKQISYINKKIHGLGFPLTCDWLKESGCEWLAKPDVHIIEVVKKITSDDKINEKETIRFMDYWAKVLQSSKKYKEVTAYKLDKVIWLLCTGNFYLHEQKIGRDMILQEIDALRRSDRGMK